MKELTKFINSALKKNLNENISNKVVYTCPVEGVVKNEQDCTHKYVLNVQGENVSIHITNFSYLTEKPIQATINTSFDTIKLLLKKAAADDRQVYGSNNDAEINKLLNEFPDNFVETVAWLYGEYAPNLKWTQL